MPTPPRADGQKPVPAGRCLGERACAAVIGRWLVRKVVGHVRLDLVVVVWAWAVGLAGAQAVSHTPPKPSQGQVAGWFLRAVLRADYAEAYQRLAPEMQRAVNLERFTASARPLRQRAGPRREISLYKLGVRLGAGQASRLFYSFAFVADSSLKTPSVLMEVTFRDTASRLVLGFGLRSTRLGPALLKTEAGKVYRVK